jgi:hypothetical protein
MNHDELKTKLLISDETSVYETLRLFQEALFSIVMLHKPEGLSTDPKCYECQGLDAVDWPCATIQAIEKELA